MNNKFRLFCRRGGMYYIENVETGQQRSLRTKDRTEANRLLHAENEAQHQPSINLQIARAYLQASDPEVATRNWRYVMSEIVKPKTGPTLRRWQMAVKDPAFQTILDLPVLETKAQHFLKVLNAGTVSTNVYLLRVHNSALDMSWLPWPVSPRRQWPVVRYRDKRAITWEEHCQIVAREKNLERRAFYELEWYLGASQSDLAHLHAEDVNWEDQTISFERMKTRWRGVEPPIIRFGPAVSVILEALPNSGPLFPYLIRVRAGDRATEFKQRCVGLGISGVSLHSYRYAWSERGEKCGYPERFAQKALGHNSKAVHRASGSSHEGIADLCFDAASDRLRPPVCWSSFRI